MKNSGKSEGAEESSGEELGRLSVESSRCGQRRPEEQLKQNVKMVMEGDQSSMLHVEGAPAWALPITLASPGPQQQGII